MNKKLSNDEVEAELHEITNLLFFMQESFDNLAKLKMKYDRMERNSASLLAHETSRCLDPLQFLQYAILDKIFAIQEGIDTSEVPVNE
ncbi:hypothetical protein BH747_04085 [Enterococcus villorum]|uniref:Uncharacterized protein n=1 Tax=Enterococcus villorum TaxID=112904 RepID=A0A1V8YQT7_9ENTE|nr:hypothetical protein [Enterococcus villorum]OQO71175.1 hypothetical protein BH747_04085 [Enterococcus villorum]OQO74995.1 hypothetical protein BH744_06325 [Enterococcus villorum]